MLSISLFAEEEIGRSAFYKHYVPTARLRLKSLGNDFLRQSPGRGCLPEMISAMCYYLPLHSITSRGLNEAAR
jgi:hypothetical protein